MNSAKPNWILLILTVATLLTAGSAPAQSGAGVPLLAGSNAPSAPPTAANFSVQIKDGLGQPVPGVAVEVYLFTLQTNATGTNEIKTILGKATSGTDGIASGVYDKSAVPTNRSFLVSLSKTGYSGVTAPPQVSYTLNQLFHSNDVATIAKLPFASLNEQIRSLLAGEMDSPKTSLADLIFAHDAELQSPLRRTVDDPYVGRQAAEMLAYIGNPDDVRLILGDKMIPQANPAVNRWANCVASALLAPTTEREWSFLKTCAMDDFGDHWVDTAGIRTLRLIASPRSLQMLKDVRDINTNRTKEIDSAIAYINSHPAPLSDRNLVTAATRAAQGLDSGSWLGNEKPRYNLKGDKALVDLNFIANGSRYVVYTATFHKDADTWKLRGIRETKTALLPAPPEPKKTQPSK